ncbi:MAG: hypothetical protein WCS99_05985, partial [Limisphaerales bacterium]
EQSGKPTGKQGEAKPGQKSSSGKRGEPQAGEGQEPGGKSGQAGKQGEEKQAGKSGKGGEQPGAREGQPGEQAGKGGGRDQPQEANSPSAGRKGGVNTAGNRGGADGSHTGDYQNGGGNRRGGWDNLLSGRDLANRDVNLAPITGGGFEQFSDRLRDAEEMVDSAELRNQLQTVRERVRTQRIEFKRGAAEPKWDLVRLQILKPLTEVRKRIEEELARRDNREAMVPIDRDPVPGRFSELVKKYYENLGKSEGEPGVAPKVSTK